MGSNVCGATVNQTYYHIPVHGFNYGQLDGYPKINDWIFEDANGVTPLLAGSYRLQDPAGVTYNATVGVTDQKGDAVAGIISAITPC